MRSLTLRILTLGAGTVVVFAGVVAVLLQVVPGPHKQLDYLVIGSVATLAALVTLFLVLLGAWGKSSEVFSKRRKDRSPGTPGEPG
jgi:hypothetical protein